MILARSCVVCATPGASPCRRCHQLLRPPRPEADPPGLEHLVTLLSYEGPARDLVARLKYRPHHQALGWLAAGLAAAVHQEVARAGGAEIGMVTWAPTTARHRRARGFDQAELIARAVARSLGAPVEATLERHGSLAQTGRRASERQSSAPVMRSTKRAPHRVSASFRRRDGPSAVLLVDDVVTTGATLRAARWALSELGFPVVVAALARTPAPGARPSMPARGRDLTGRAQ